jgi:hypothetical protein
MTHRLIDYILARVATQSMITQVALDTGQDLQTVIDVFVDAVEKWDAERGMDLPIKLAIDEAHFAPNRIYTILVDSGGTRGTIDVLKNRANATIAKRLKGGAERKGRNASDPGLFRSVPGCCDQASRHRAVREFLH